jgi:hypothetical protein
VTIHEVAHHLQNSQWSMREIVRTGWALLGLCKMIPEQVTEEDKFNAWVSASTF